MNVCALIGRIATDPDLRYTPQGTPVCRFRLGVRRPRRSEEQGQGDDIDWLTIVAFGRQAETVVKYLDKGALVAVIGRIQARRWQTHDGQQRESVEIIARRVEFLETRAEAERRRAEMATADVGPEPEPDLPPPDEDNGTIPDDDMFADM